MTPTRPVPNTKSWWLRTKAVGFILVADWSRSLSLYCLQMTVCRSNRLSLWWTPLKNCSWKNIKRPWKRDQAPARYLPVSVNVYVWVCAGMWRAPLKNRWKVLTLPVILAFCTLLHTLKYAMQTHSHMDCSLHLLAIVAWCPVISVHDSHCVLIEILSIIHILYKLLFSPTNITNSGENVVNATLLHIFLFLSLTHTQIHID